MTELVLDSFLVDEVVYDHSCNLGCQSNNSSSDLESGVLSQVDRDVLLNVDKSPELGSLVFNVKFPICSVLESGVESRN